MLMKREMLNWEIKGKFGFLKMSFNALIKNTFFWKRLTQYNRLNKTLIKENLGKLNIMSSLIKRSNYRSG